MVAGIPIESHGYIQKIAKLLEGQPEVYLVGGSVRDLLLQRPIHDLDLVLSGDVRAVARRIANAVGGAFYMLDETRNTARVIDRRADGEPVMLDFAQFRADDLIGDLKGRDFTINAMALELKPGARLIDPTGGASDLRANVLRACSSDAMKSDPVRVLRGVRLALMLGFQIEPDTFRLIRSAVPLLPQVTWERKRDELFRMLEGRKVSSSLRILDHIGALAHLLPEFTDTRDISQSPPHTLPVFDHTLLMLNHLEDIFEVLVGAHDPEAGSNLILGIATVKLGRFRIKLEEHFSQALNPNRSLRALLFLAALYHDVGKAATQRVEENGRIRFFGHEALSAELVAGRGRSLVLSQVEIHRLKTVVANHMRVHHLANNPRLPSQRAIYRYFRALGPAGVDVCLLSLADVLATHGVSIPVEVWQREVDICRILLESWWEKPDEIVSPPKLISGSDVIDAFRGVPGPVIGRLLEAVQEAQVMGSIQTRQDALTYAETWLRRKYPAALHGENEEDG